MFHKKAPFKGRNVSEVKKNLKQNKIVFKKDIDPQVKEWIIKMLNILPKKRPKVSEVLKCPLFDEISQELKIQRNISKNLNSQPSLKNETKENSKIGIYSNEKKNKIGFQSENMKKQNLFNKKIDQTKKNNLIGSNKSKVTNLLNGNSKIFHSLKKNGIKMTQSKNIGTGEKTKLKIGNNKKIGVFGKNKSTSRIITGIKTQNLGSKKFYQKGNYEKLSGKSFKKKNVASGNNSKLNMSLSNNQKSKLSKAQSSTTSDLKVNNTKKMRKNLVRFNTFGEKGVLGKFEDQMTFKKEQISPQSFKKKGVPDTIKETVIYESGHNISKFGQPKPFISSFDRANKNKSQESGWPNSKVLGQSNHIKSTSSNSQTTDFLKKIKKVPLSSKKNQFGTLTNKNKAFRSINAAKSPLRNVKTSANPILSVTSPHPKQSSEVNQTQNSGLTRKLNLRNPKPFAKLKHKFNPGAGSAGSHVKNATMRSSKFNRKIHSKSVYSDKIVRTPNNFSFHKFMKNKVGSLRKNIVAEVKPKSKSLLGSIPLQNANRRFPQTLKINNQTSTGNGKKNVNNTSLLEKTKINRPLVKNPVSPNSHVYFSSFQRNNKASSNKNNFSLTMVRSSNQTNISDQSKTLKKLSNENSPKNEKKESKNSDIINRSKNISSSAVQGKNLKNIISTGGFSSKNLKTIFKSQDRRRFQLNNNSKNKSHSAMNQPSFKPFNQKLTAFGNSNSSKIQKIFKPNKNNLLKPNQNPGLKTHTQKNLLTNFRSEKTSPIKTKTRTKLSDLQRGLRIGKPISQQTPSQPETAQSSFHSNYVSHQPSRSQHQVINWIKPHTPKNLDSSKSRLKTLKVSESQKFQVLKPRKPMNSKTQFKSMSPSSSNMRRILSNQTGYLSFAGQSNDVKKMHFFQPKIINKVTKGSYSSKNGSHTKLKGGVDLKVNKGKMQKLTNNALANVHSKSHMQKQIKAYQF